jgi:thiamine biosynthesis lipoprotein
MKTTENHETRLPGRREFLALGIGAFLVATLPRAARPDRRLVRRQLPLMGTIAEIAVVTRDARWAHGAIDAAFAELLRVDRTMSHFRADSDVGRVNAGGIGVPVAVAADTMRVVEEALRWAGASGGRFDPALARATALWDVLHRRVPPAEGEIRRWAGRELWRAVEPGRFRGRGVIVLRDPDAALDLGGIAKGYGVDRAADALRRWGVTNALVTAGGDLYALGRSLEGDAWEVGVQSPFDPARLIATLRVEDRGVATSGDYERFFVHARRRYHHLLDPRTGAPRRTPRHAVTVTGATCAAADGAGTTVFGLDRAAAERLTAAVDPSLDIANIS